jgi:hypothetical protein
VEHAVSAEAAVAHKIFQVFAPWRAGHVEVSVGEQCR